MLPEPQTTSARLLAMAVALRVDKSKLRQHMKLSDAELASLLAGDRELSWAELDLLTDLLVREQGFVIDKNRDLVELLRLRATRSA
jgi:hypothetical protein